MPRRGRSATLAPNHLVIFINHILQDDSCGPCAIQFKKRMASVCCSFLRHWRPPITVSESLSLPVGSFKIPDGYLLIMSSSHMYFLSYGFFVLLRTSPPQNASSVFFIRQQIPHQRACNATKPSTHRRRAAGMMVRPWLMVFLMINV